MRRRAFEQANQTYVGIETGATYSTIKQVDTGLSFITGTSPSTASNVISMSVGNSGSDIIMVAWSSGTKICWGIQDNTATGAYTTTAAWSPANTTVGTFYGQAPANTSSACQASTFTASTGTSTSGFSGT